MCSLKQWMHLLMEQECVHTGVSAQGACTLDMSTEVRKKLSVFLNTYFGLFLLELIYFTY